MDILLRGHRSLIKVLQIPRSNHLNQSQWFGALEQSIWVLCADSRERKMLWKPLRSSSTCLPGLLISIVKALCAGLPKKPCVQWVGALSWWRSYACRKWLQNPAIAQQWSNRFLSCLYLPRKLQWLFSMFQGFCLFFSFLSSIQP